nr:signaling recognition particle receptor family protein [Marinicella sp. W31]MDC2879084.1 signaling recognition particle receptor family protein [Marinicella sp. W31]
MALGFMKNVFTFGKKEAPKEEQAVTPEEEAETAATAEPEQPEQEKPEPKQPTEAVRDAESNDPWDDDSIVGGVVGRSHEQPEQAEETPVAHEANAPEAPLAVDETAAEAPAEEPPQVDETRTCCAQNHGFEITSGPKPEAPAPQPAKRLSWFQRLKAGLFRTSQQLSGQIAALFTKRKLDEEALEELEDLLIQADLGVETAMRITDALSSERYGRDVTGTDVSRIMAGEITKVLGPVAKPLALDLSKKPHVILVVGVNGTGKTTTIGKLAAKLTRSGLKVTLGAGDTFRAAAIEQLKIWADRTGAEFVGTKLGADAAGLAYDAFKRGQENGSDVVIIDTAGRLQNKAELMEELAKIVRVLGKLDPEAPIPCCKRLMPPPARTP